MQIPYFIIFTPIALFFFSCKKNNPPSPYDHIKDEKVKTILKKAIDQAGGWEAYQNVDSIFYTKRTVLYDEKENVESDVTQFHKYQLKPELAMSIIWEQDSMQHEIVYKKERAIKKVNNKIVEADTTVLKRTCMSAYYVLFMPFKLLDPGVELTYKGIISLPQNENVHAIAANYNSNENDSTSEKWEYYFDKFNGDFIASMVDHGDYFALIYNSEYVEAGGLRFNVFRPSYRVNEDRTHLWQRGEFYYSDFVVK